MVQWHVKRSFPPIVVAMATVTLAASEELHDPRFPHNIVNPPPECVERGSFPHPRNCSWFYRCEDLIREGFFRIEYFECGPGTVFSDEADQCFHATDVPPPCGTKSGNGPAPPQPGGSTPQPGGSTPQPGGSSPQPGGSTTPQPGGSSPQPGGSTTPQPGGSTSIASFCKTNDTVCEKYEVCEPTQETRNLCTGCYVGEMFVSVSQICKNDNHVLDGEEKTCVFPPEDSELCKSTAV